MSIFILHPQSLPQDSPGELEALNDVFTSKNVSVNSNQISEGDIVVPRYRAIPFGRELEIAVKSSGASLINSFRQHRNIADLRSWVNLLDGLTPPAYTIEDFPRIPEGEYFLKGETNSKKNDWFNSSYAESKQKVMEIFQNLSADLWLASQTIVIRPFQNYRKLGTAVDGRPIFHERRVFVLNGQVISEGFYWSSHVDQFGGVTAKNESVYRETLSEAIGRVKHLASFIVVDMAEYEDGSWGVVELNDGCMSGLSENSPYTLWSNFKKVLEG